MPNAISSQEILKFCADKTRSIVSHNCFREDRRCHQDQIRERSPDVEVLNPEAPHVFDSPTPTVEAETPTEVVLPPPPTASDGGCIQASPPVEHRIYPSRDRKTMDRYESKW